MYLTWKYLNRRAHNRGLKLCSLHFVDKKKINNKLKIPPEVKIEDMGQ